MKIKPGFTIVFLMACNSLLAQSGGTVLTDNTKALEKYVFAHPIEKVHLHLDRSWYSLGDTIWFKAYRVKGASHLPSNISGVLYPDLINENDSVKNHLNLQLNLGLANGDFVIPYTYKAGTYRLRAYTNWMRNDSDYFFDQKIIIGGIKSTSDLDTAKPGIKQKSDEEPDIQFFPEGGYLVNGLRSKVAFKAIDKSGISVNVLGTITDDDNNLIANINTQHAGMGLFAITPIWGKHYRAKILCADSSTYYVALPTAKNSGFTLTINNTPDSIYVKIAAADSLLKSKTDTAFYLVAQSGGKYYFAAGGKLENQVYSTKIETSRFPSGITQFTLFSQNGEPLNERIIFIENKDKMQLAVSTEREVYMAKEKVKLAIAAKKEGDKAVTGSFSVAVTDETKVPVEEQSENTIFTDLLLTSELKGNIENPNYYFSKENQQSRADLDLLMLTQGYHRYEWKKILKKDSSKAQFQPESALNLAGRITSLSKKPIPGGKIRLTSVKDIFVADTLSDIEGNFIFNNLNLGDTTKVVINAKKANGGNNVLIAIKQPGYPAVNKINLNSFSLINTEITSVLADALKKDYITGQQNYFKTIHMLKEVQIKSRRNTYFNPVYSDNMKFSANLNGPGIANEVILGDQLIAGGGGLLSQILPSKMPFVTFKNGLPYNWRTGGNKPMAIFIEGGQVSPEMLDAINPDDIYSIEVLRSVSYLAIYGSNAPNGALIITMKHGSDYKPENEAVNGLITYKFKGFYKAREFYSPKFDVKTTAAINDDRKTIYWNPDIITDANGKASFEFFNASSPGTYRVVVEGIDGYGNLGRQVFRYRVE